MTEPAGGPGQGGAPASPTLAELRPAPGAEEVALLRRTIDMHVFERDGYHVVIGSLHDQRPWASGQAGPRDVHRMELGIVVRCADLVIVDAAATMGLFPHPECTNIESAFSELIGMSVARGYTRAVQDRFGRQRGCSHLEFLARALGPVVIQAMTAAAARRMEDGSADALAGAGGGLEWLTNTCHIWSEDGIGMQKLAAQWSPGKGEYPAPSLVEIRRRAGTPDPPQE
jgi:Protein of unknown function (DUF2889)